MVKTLDFKDKEKSDTNPGEKNRDYLQILKQIPVLPQTSLGM